MKKAVSLILVLVMSFAFVGNALAAGLPVSGDCGAEGNNVKWTLDSSGTMTISGTGAMKDYETPDLVPWWKDYRNSIQSVVIENGVTSVGRSAFCECQIKSVVIADSVTSIGTMAFEESGFTSVKLPNRLTSIGSYAFSACQNLTSIIIPEGVTNVEGFAFFNCQNLASVTLPHSLTSIGIKVFAGCKKLKSITIPNSVTSIAESAFDYSGLTSITIPDSVTQIGKNAFSSSALKSVTISKNVTTIEDGTFKTTELTNVTIPDGVTRIGRQAFAVFMVLHSVTIPKSVTSIDESAFEGCTGLTDVYYNGSRTQWAAISIGENNEYLINATIHFNGESEAAATAPVPAARIAFARSQSVELDGKSVTLPAYALKEANGGETNYVKLRDLASLLSGTAAEFNVGWDGAINIEANTAYVSNGSEMTTPFSGDRSYQATFSPIRINGTAADMQGIVLTDDAGGGYNYFKLRDVGKALGFNVGWSSARGIYIESDKPYVG